MTALRFDVDSEGAGAAWIEAELPAPNLIVVNPDNGHAHLIYMLGAWVRTDFGDATRLRVVRYAAAIERAYAAALGADRAYSGRFHHNPLSDAYITKIGRQEPYSLSELAQYVDMYSPTLKAAAPQGIGRNVEIFDRLRRWAYTAVADWKIGTRECWDKVVSERAAQIAGDVGADSPRGPLPENEVGHIVKSVSRWVWERYTAGSPPLLREEQLARRRASERARQGAREAERARSKQTRAEYLARAQQRRIEAAQLRSRGMSLRAIGRALACSVAEVHRLLLSTVHWHLDDSTLVDGIDFYVGEKELGHMHLDGSIHLATNATLGATLIAEGVARRFPHARGWVCENVDRIGTEATIALFRRNFERLLQLD